MENETSPYGGFLTLGAVSIYKVDSTPQTNGTFNGTVSFKFGDPNGMSRYDLEEQIAVEWDFIFSLTNDSSKCENPAWTPCVSYMDNTLKKNILNVTGREWVNISFTINLDTNEVNFYNSLDFTNHIYNTTHTITSITSLHIYSFSALTYWDNIGCGVITPVICDFPLLFCDDFNYNYPMLTENWFVYDESFSIDDSFTPINNELVLNESYYQPFHTTEPFPVDYLIAPNLKVTESYYSPVFSVEFDLLLSGNYTPDLSYCMNYETYSPANDVIFDLYFCPNQSVYYYQTDLQQNDFYYLVCDNCITRNSWESIKINSYFKQDGNSPYNTSITDSYSRLFINGQLKSGYIPFVNNHSYAMQKYNIIKDYNVNFSIDNYYVMVGTDKDIITTSQFYTHFYDNTTEIPLDIGDIGSSCRTDDDCSSGKCVSGICVSKLKGEECTDNSQCLSGKCIYGLCTKPSVWELLDASKTEQFGDDKESNNFVALLLMLFIPGIIIFTGKSGLAVFMGIFAFLVLGFFFAIVGWLSPFILIAIILGVLIMVVLLFMLKGSSD